MLNRCLLPLLVAAGCTALAGAGPAHAAAGKIAGTVTDAVTGDALANANVLLTETEAAATTDTKGRFFLLNVSPGIYTLRATYVGYRAVTVEEVRVSADLTTSLEFLLGGEAIQVEEVVIKAERPIIDKNATNAVRIVEAEDLEILPGRGLGSVINLQPGVVMDEGVLHIRGSRSDEVGYYVDGASVRNPGDGHLGGRRDRRGPAGDPAPGRRLQRRVRRRQRGHHPAGTAHRLTRLGGRVAERDGWLHLSL